MSKVQSYVITNASDLKVLISISLFLATHQDAVMAVLPFFHIYAGTVVMFHKLAQGVKLVTLDKFQPEPFFRAIEKFKTNLLFIAPPIGES